MEYQPEELLKIVSRLADKYTSKESSSVTYENAQMLMEAVIYCIEEGLGGKEYLQAEDVLPECELVYQRGCEIIESKVYQAKEIYDRILVDFEDYGCCNYGDFIRKGIPAFFLRYDSKFAPQDHLLNMDYPSLNDSNICGIRRILSCLEGIEKEQKFLSVFSPDSVKEVLRGIMPDYEKIYMDNICEPVLLHGIGCIIADKSLQELVVSKEEWKEVGEYFAGDTQEQIEHKIKGIIGLLMRRVVGEEYLEYFLQVSRRYAARFAIVYSW